MKKSILLCLVILTSAIATPTIRANASEEAPEFCRTFKTAQDYKGIPRIRWDRLFPRCVRHTIGDGTSVDPTIFDIVYRTALQHQNGIRDDREKALDYYKLLLRDRKRDWRGIVSHRVDEYADELTSLGYPYKSSAKVLADIKQKAKEFKREVSGRNRISIGNTGTVEIPENLSIGQKFVVIIGAAIIADIANGLSGAGPAQNTDLQKQDYENRKRELEQSIRNTENFGWYKAGE